VFAQPLDGVGQLRQPALAGDRQANHCCATASSNSSLLS
jgi:hypothetical protein